MPVSIQRRDLGASISDHFHKDIRARDFREKDRLEDQEEEIMEFGASTDEWKLLWSTRKG